MFMALAASFSVFSKMKKTRESRPLQLGKQIASYLGLVLEEDSSGGGE